MSSLLFYLPNYKSTNLFIELYCLAEMAGAPGLNNREHACPFFVIESLFINLFFNRSDWSDRRFEIFSHK